MMSSRICAVTRRSSTGDHCADPLPEISLRTCATRRTDPARSTWPRRTDPELDLPPDCATGSALGRSDLRMPAEYYLHFFKYAFKFMKERVDKLEYWRMREVIVEEKKKEKELLHR
ncbi:Uncharacterized protein Fot_38387 [Forsythia ovata]|uniref:Uncharacterized protein n=1 Tax=Forsythia ovata TaxID=205694 RepID=A0ABD1S1N5_9LAMI